jgi:DNA polymerase I-like protein with 3'-5' exonuclease and polymerase domains
VPRLRSTRADKALVDFGRDFPLVVAVDTETTGLEFYDEPFAATLTWRGREGSLVSHYLPLEQRARQLPLDGPVRDASIAALRFILGKTTTWVFHNAKFDLQKLLLVGAIDPEWVEAVELHDTQTEYMLLDENGSKRLKDLAVRVLQYDDTVQVPYKTKGREHEFKTVSREKYLLDEARKRMGLTKDDGFFPVPRSVIVPYALRDTDFTLQLHEVLLPRLEAKNDPELLAAYRRGIEIKRVLLRIESDGLLLDLPYLQAKASEYGVKVMEAWEEVVRLSGDPDINVGSWQQLQKTFAARGITLENTQADTLRKLSDPLAGAILEYREVKKIHTTYLQGLLRMQRNGLAHPNFNEDAAKTGRTSSSGAHNN